MGVGKWVEQRGTSDGVPVLQALQGCESLQISLQVQGGTVQALCTVPVPLRTPRLRCSSRLRLPSQE